MKCFQLAAWSCAVIAFAAPVRSGELALDGSEFQVNSYTTGFQLEPHLAALPGGGFVAAWGSLLGGPRLMAQRFDADGFAIGGFKALEDGGQGTDPWIAVQQDGDFVVAWDDSTDGITARRFDSVGDPVGASFVVETYTTGNPQPPRIAVAPDDRFLVVWSNDGSPENDDSSISAQGRFLDSAGLPVGTQFQVNSYTTNGQIYPVAAFDEAGGFLVVWAGSGIRGQRFASDGARLGAELQISTSSNGHSVPSLSSAPLGEFVAAWQCSQEVCARRLDPDGMPLGSQIQVNAYTTGLQQRPRVTSGGDGRFTVAWTSLGSFGSDSDAESIQARNFDSAGAPRGMDLQVNSITSGKQTSATLLARHDDFVVAWGSYEVPDDLLTGVRARFLVDLEIFNDGFEFGDLAAWSDFVTP